ncbi:MAG: M4 family metallopeptidase [Planctomycetota bacterium]
MHGLHCILAPYVVEHMAKSSDAAVRRMALDVVESGAAARAVRSLYATMPAMAAIPSPARTRHRLIYDARNKGYGLPGKMVRSEGDPKHDDPAVNEAYRHAGAVYGFYRRVFGRNSLDDQGMSLIASVHYRRRHNNAYWNGEQLLFGDGDGKAFVRFTKALDIVAHEFSHGVVTHTACLDYEGESGAVCEHVADVMGVLTRQWRRREDARTGDWSVGRDCLGPAVKADGLRTFLDRPAYENDALLGTDRQPKHIDDRYTGQEDNGGVHINSGIPNHAFFRVAHELRGSAWERAGRIWYDALLLLGRRSGFVDLVEKTECAAALRYGRGSVEVRAVRKAWKKVGLA